MSGASALTSATDAFHKGGEEFMPLYNPAKLSWPGNPGHPGDAFTMPKTYYVYILASKRNGTLYIGVTNDLARRLEEHRDGVLPGFTKRYGVTKLVYYEVFDDIHVAIYREAQMKKYKREWKINLIERDNKDWMDLATSL
jgi:putative endonuclease